MRSYPGPRPRLFLGDVLLIAEPLRRAPAGHLAKSLPPSILGWPPDVPLVGGCVLHSDTVEEAALLWARIMRERWFGDRSRAIGFACVGMLLDPDAEVPWPDELDGEVDRTSKAFEAGAIDEPELIDWVGSWLALARQRRDEATA